jgi:hypothetical protein
MAPQSFAHFFSAWTKAQCESRQKLTPPGSFNNYVDKKRGVGVNGNSTLGHMTMGRYKMSIFVHFSGRGSKLCKIWST